MMEDSSFTYRRKMGSQSEAVQVLALPLLNIRCTATVLLLLLVHSCLALPPPHPDYEEQFQEEVRAYREANGIATSLEKEHQHHRYSPHRCLFLSEDDCRRDLALEKEDSDRQLVRIGQGIRVMVLLCRFTDHKDRDLPDSSYFEELFNGSGQSDVNPVGSIREWLYTSSLGKYEVTFEVQPKWRTTSNTEAHFAAGRSGLRGAEEIHDLFVPVLDEIDNEGYNWENLDVDGWGEIDHLVVIHSGYPAEIGGNKECTGNTSADRIWSQGTAGTPRGWTSADGIYSTRRFLISGAFAGPACDGNPVEMGVICHEYMHGFGLFDLYDNDKDEAPLSLLGGTGHFGIMNNLMGWQRDGKIPGHMNPYSRVLAGWLEPIDITEDGYYPIQPCEFSSQVYRITKNYPFGEYLYIENRQPYLCGIVIYKVDENTDLQKTRGYPGHPNWPTEHYMVSVLQADGNFDIEQGINHGDEGDFWKMGQKLSPGGSFPNSDAIAFGDRKNTGIEIEVVSDTEFVILIRVSGVS